VGFGFLELYQYRAYVFSGEQDIQLGKNETLRDTAEVLGRFNDVILARVFGHKDVLELAEFSGGTPVINALSDMHHPLQVGIRSCWHCCWRDIT
jgi:ornithine carbamoyltransferase